jgi:hypothetical protein
MPQQRRFYRAVGPVDCPSHPGVARAWVAVAPTRAGGAAPRVRSRLGLRRLSAPPSCQGTLRTLDRSPKVSTILRNRPVRHGVSIPALLARFW